MGERLILITDPAQVEPGHRVRHNETGVDRWVNEQEPQLCPGSNAPIERAPFEHRGPQGFCTVCERVVDCDDEVADDHPWPYGHPPQDGAPQPEADDRG